jgi:hypothetical protein
VRVSAAIVTVAVDTTTQRLLLVLAAVLVGASVGLLGALIFGAVKGMRATPGRAAAVQRSGPPPTRPRPARQPRPVPQPRPARQPRPAPQPRAAPPSRAEPDPPASSPFAAPGAIGSVPTLYAMDSEVARERHRELYEAEYVKQLDRVNALRHTIGSRLALAGEPHQPSEPPDPSEELDA